MSRLFPHAEYAEDQKFSHSLLAFHVLHRAFQLGALDGAIASVPLYYGTKYLTKPSKFPAINTVRGTLAAMPYKSLLLKSSGIGAVGGVGLLTLGLEARMFGRENIEWKDRAWRLLENKYQMEVDDFALLGTAVGAYLARQGDWKMKVGGAALGNLVGVADYMIWRHGIKGGKFAADERGL